MALCGDSIAFPRVRVIGRVGFCDCSYAEVLESCSSRSAGLGRGCVKTWSVSLRWASYADLTSASKTERSQSGFSRPMFVQFLYKWKIPPRFYTASVGNCRIFVGKRLRSPGPNARAAVSRQQCRATCIRTSMLFNERGFACGERIPARPGRADSDMPNARDQFFECRTVASSTCE